METQEQKSKLQNTTVKAISVESMAQPYQSILTIAHDELRGVFDEYWKEHSQVLVDKFNVKLERKKEGKIDFKKAQNILEKTIKPNKLYREPLIDIFMNKMDEFKEEKGVVLFLEGIKLSGFENVEQDSFVIGTFYYTPELKLLEDLDFVAEKPYEENWDRVWTAKVENLKNKHKLTTPCEEGINISEGMTVLIDIHASRDGKPDPNLSLKLKWLEVDRIESETFKAELFKHKKGETFDVIYEVDDDGEKEASAQVKIHEVSYVVYPEVDDDLIKKEGDFETLTDYKKSEQDKYQEYLNNILAMAASDHILNQIATRSKIPPAPMGWINSIARQGMDNHIAQSGGDAKNAMKAIGAGTESDMLNLFCDQANSEYVRHLTTRKYASMHGIEYTDSDAIVDDMVKRMEWKDE